MDERRKKLAAAMAGVAAFLDEEAAARTVAAAPVVFQPAWSRWGREEIMRMRTLVTARLWK